MEGRGASGLRIALVDLDAQGLDTFRGALEAAWSARGEDPVRVRGAEVRFVVGDRADGALFRWARLAAVPRSGEVAALGGVVLDAVVVGTRSPRAPAASRLAASLGARVVVLSARAGTVTVEAQP